VAVTTGVLALTGVRERAAAALAPVDPTDPAVFVEYVDALDPPALMIGWDDPWLEAGFGGRPVFGPCEWEARLAIICVAARVEPGPGIQTLEELVAYTINRLRADDYPWPVATVQAPRQFTIGNIPLLGARVGYRVPVTV